MNGNEKKRAERPFRVAAMGSYFFFPSFFFIVIMILK